MRSIYAGIALALAVASMVALPALSASASSAATAVSARSQSSGSGPGQNLSATFSPSWQTNNTVWAIAPVNGDVYVGGSFTSVRPPGDPAGTGEVASTYLAEFDASTGALGDVLHSHPRRAGHGPRGVAGWQYPLCRRQLHPRQWVLPQPSRGLQHLDRCPEHHLGAQRGQLRELHRGVPRRIGRLHRRDLRQARRRRARPTPAR